MFNNNSNITTINNNIYLFLLKNIIKNNLHTFNAKLSQSLKEKCETLTLFKQECYICFLGSFLLCSCPTVRLRSSWGLMLRLVERHSKCILGVWLNKHATTITAPFADGLYDPSLHIAPSGFVEKGEKCTRHEKTLNTFHACALLRAPWWECRVCFSSGWVPLWVCKSVFSDQ